MWKNFTDAFYLNFISDDRWHYIADGLKTTLIITFFACMMGIVLGFIVGMIRSTHDKTGKLKLLNILCKIYLTVIRGTPVVVQLLKTAYEIRNCDWSSDVCSSDLIKYR